MSLPFPAPGRDPWSGLSHDPRLPAHAHLRAAHQDREAVAQVLAEAYADGRLALDEYEERCSTLVATKTLGELPSLVADLVWTGPPGPSSGTGSLAPVADSAAIRAEATATYVRERRNAWRSMWWFTLLATTVWMIGALGDEDGALQFDPYFFWPVFVLLATGFHYGTLVLQRQQRIQEEVARLERKAAKKARKSRKRRGELPPGQ